MKTIRKPELLRIVTGTTFAIALATAAWAKPAPRHWPPPHHAPEVNPTLTGIEGLLAAAGVTGLVLARRRSRKTA
jgi:MYXO-CTERM domain-containing protein